MFVAYPPRRVFPSYPSAFSSQESFESWLILHFFHSDDFSHLWLLQRLLMALRTSVGTLLVALHFFLVFSQTSPYETVFIVQRIHMKEPG